MGLAADQFSNTNGNFNVTFTVNDGYVKINPVTDKVTVTVKGNKVTEKYDGNPHTATGYTVDISNPLYAEDNIEFTGTTTVTRTDAGTTGME